MDRLLLTGDEMPKTTLAFTWRYGCALLSVTLATAARLAFAPLVGDRYPFFAFIAAIVFTAWYAGFGPSILTLVLSWCSLDYLVLRQRDPFLVFENKYEVGFGFFLVGLTVTLLAESIRVAQRRALGERRRDPAGDRRPAGGSGMAPDHAGQHRGRRDHDRLRCLGHLPEPGGRATHGLELVGCRRFARSSRSSAPG